MTAAGVRERINAIGRYVGDLMGDRHYQRYLDHHRRRHPAEQPMSESEYWRTRYAAQDSSPQGRCC
ncbi:MULTISPECIES: YbdD/YjiX family protein [unclassified Gordonia (in: high G+C Gram-positive bacteria)]|uniref:YbdD/YjiX family protein n=1 Tax=unclassified Gordonia (in: high G+C Gram-positive bacteria) TaxID=2657482 RepID=UPI001F11894B|nr:YbdD/YjiX family protein [Gordonia sp. ABSL49_1]MCH5643689.1 YbdD/YjiX family protein [Gordonia sp. ABSL49_1]